jgi:hypothetical protein
MAPSRPRPPLGVIIWYAWAVLLLVITGLLLPKIIAFVDVSEKAPFSILGLVMMAELAVVFFGITVAMQRKRVARGFTIFIAMLPAPILAGLVPLLLDLESDAAGGWTALFLPLGLILSVILIIGLRQGASLAWFNED